MTHHSAHTPGRPVRLAPAVAAVAALTLTWPCAAQSLFQRPISPPPAPPAPTVPQQATPSGQPAATPGGPEAGGGPDQMASKGTQPIAPQAGSSAMTVDQLSLFAVTPPAPRRFQKHDKIEVIINETSLQKAEQSLDTKKKYDLKAELSQFPSLRRLLEDATIANGIGSPTPSVGVKGNSAFKGEGTAERKDRFTARISALVLEVKPNGLLLIEARESQQFDSETKSLVVSGMCDPKDLTAQGTVQSSQLANLVIRVEHTGDLRDGAKKGWIPQIMETVFGM